MPIRKWSKWFLFLISIVCPGSAHFLLRQKFKGFVIIFSLVFHILFIFTLYKHQLFQEPLTIVIWLLALCVHFFYSVFDTLQQYEFSQYKSTISVRLKLAAISIFAWGIVVVASFFINELAQTIVYFYPYTFTFFTVLYLMTHLKSAQWKSFYVGRWSAILFLSIVIVTGLGFEFMWNHLQLKVVIILLVGIVALEISVFYMVKKLADARWIHLRFDVVAIITISLYATIFLTVPKYGNLPSELLKSFHNVDRYEYNYDITHYRRNELQPLSVTTNEMTKLLHISNRNGVVKVQSYDGDYIKIVPTRYDVSNVEFQEQINTINQVEVTLDGQQMMVETKLAQFEGQVSQMDIVVFVPHSLRMDELNITVEHGTVHLMNIKQFDSVNIDGRQVNVNSLFSSGDIAIKIIEGTSYVYEQNGTVNVKTSSGNIMLYNILLQIQVETLNGNIFISNRMLNESIYTHAGVGSVQINLPNAIVYNLLAETSFGTITIKDKKYDNNASLSTSITKKEIHVYADQNIVID